MMNKAAGKQVWSILNLVLNVLWGENPSIMSDEGITVWIRSAEEDAALLHLTVVENDHTGVSVVLLLHLVFGIDALPLDLRTRKKKHKTFTFSDAICDASSRERQHKQKFQCSRVHNRIKLLMRPLLINRLLNLLV